MLCLNKSERLKRTKYDPSEYVFPSLKRKKKDPSEAGNESKSCAVRKKKKTAPVKQTPSSPQSQSSSAPSPIKPTFESNHIMKIEFPQPNQCLCVICNCLGTSKTDDVMMSCSSCTSKAHSNCIKGVKDPNILHWICSRCEGMDSLPTCSVCDKGIARSHLVTCSYCHENYHRSCHTPVIVGSIECNWRCFGCPPAEVSEVEMEDLVASVKEEEPSEQVPSSSNSMEEVQAPSPSSAIGEKEITEMELPPPPLKVIKMEDDAPPPKDSSDLFLGVPIDPSIPDPSSWSPSQVCQYFEKFFSKEVASVFQDQDIDGRALLLMRRSDVLQGLGLKVGVGLKILYHIKKFQIRRSDLRLLWTL